MGSSRPAGAKLTEAEVAVDNTMTVHEAKPLQNLAQHAARPLLRKLAARTALHGLEQVAAPEALQLKEQVAVVLVNRVHEHHVAVGRPLAQVVHRANLQDGILRNAPPVQTAAQADGTPRGIERGRGVTRWGSNAVPGGGRAGVRAR